jgi:hypothetical protein
MAGRRCPQYVGFHSEILVNIAQFRPIAAASPYLMFGLVHVRANCWMCAFKAEFGT